VLGRLRVRVRLRCVVRALVEALRRDQWMLQTQDEIAVALVAATNAAPARQAKRPVAALAADIPHSPLKMIVLSIGASRICLNARIVLIAPAASSSRRVATTSSVKPV